MYTWRSSFIWLISCIHTFTSLWLISSYKFTFIFLSTSSELREKTEGEPFVCHFERYLIALTTWEEKNPFILNHMYRCALACIKIFNPMTMFNLFFFFCRSLYKTTSQKLRNRLNSWRVSMRKWLNHSLQSMLRKSNRRQMNIKPKFRYYLSNSVWCQLTIYMKLPINLWHCMVLFFYFDRSTVIKKNLSDRNWKPVKGKSQNSNRSISERVLVRYIIMRVTEGGDWNASRMPNQHARVSDVKIYFLLVERNISLEKRAL